MGDVLKEVKDLDITKVITFVVVPLLFLFGFFFIPIESHEIEFPTTVYVSSEQKFIDIKVDKVRDTLDFGGVSAGYKVDKYINLNIGENAPPADVSFKVQGDIKDFIVVHKDPFVIKEPTQIMVSAVIPREAEAKTYSGTLKVIYSKTLFRKLLNLF